MKALVYIIVFFALPALGQQYSEISLQQPNPDTVRVKTAEIRKIFSTDTITITIQRVGCYIYTKESYELIKEGAFYGVEFYFNDSYDSVKICKQHRRITSEKFKEIRQLCMRGASLPIGGCTTGIIFTIQNKIATTQFIDGRCYVMDDLGRLLSGLAGIKCAH